MILLGKLYVLSFIDTVIFDTGVVIVIIHIIYAFSGFVASLFICNIN